MAYDYGRNILTTTMSLILSTLYALKFIINCRFPPLYIIFYLYNRQAYIVAVALNLEWLYDTMIRLPT